MPSESAIQRRIMAALRERGAYVFHAMAADAGTPDLIVCWQGRFVGLEVKQPGKYATKIQKHRHAQIMAAGGVAAVVRSVEEALAVVGISSTVDTCIHLWGEWSEPGQKGVIERTCGGCGSVNIARHYRKGQGVTDDYEAWPRGDARSNAAPPAVRAVGEREATHEEPEPPSLP